MSQYYHFVQTRKGARKSQNRARVWFAVLISERKECREGELNADCESFSSDLTNFTILERAMCCERTKKATREKARDRDREREKSRE